MARSTYKKPLAPLGALRGSIVLLMVLVFSGVTLASNSAMEPAHDWVRSVYTGDIKPNPNDPPKIGGEFVSIVAYENLRAENNLPGTFKQARDAAMMQDMDGRTCLMQIADTLRFGSAKLVYEAYAFNFGGGQEASADQVKQELRSERVPQYTSWPALCDRAGGIYKTHFQLMQTFFQQLEEIAFDPAELEWAANEVSRRQEQALLAEQERQKQIELQRERERIAREEEAKVLAAKRETERLAREAEEERLAAEREKEQLARAERQQIDAERERAVQLEAKQKKDQMLAGELPIESCNDAVDAFDATDASSKFFPRFLPAVADNKIYVLRRSNIQFQDNDAVVLVLGGQIPAMFMYAPDTIKNMAGSSGFYCGVGKWVDVTDGGGQRVPVLKAIYLGGD